jgi:hypothetical protein
MQRVPAFICSTAARSPAWTRLNFFEVVNVPHNMGIAEQKGSVV